MIRASFGKSVARSTLLGGLALLAVPAIAGCEAGNNAPTLQFHNAAAGAYSSPSPGSTPSPVTVSNAFVLGAPSGSSLPAGASASLFVGLFNTGSQADKLVSVSAPGVAASVEIKGGSVAIPANGAANLAGPQPTLVLKGLTAPLQNGTSVPVKLVFANAGEIDLTVPVEPQSFYWSTYSPPASASPSASPSGSAKPKPGASTKPKPAPSKTK